MTSVAGSGIQPLPSSSSSSSTSASSASSASVGRNGPNATLTASVLSAYDLPSNSTAPSYVSLSVSAPNSIDKKATMIGRTGPPLSQHRDGNSFRFQTSSLNESQSSSSSDAKKPNEIVLKAPLASLYPSTVTFRVTYNNNSNGKDDLIGHVSLKKELLVNEPKWLVLHLKPISSPSASSSNSANAKKSTAMTVPATSPASTPSTAATTEDNDPASPTLRIKLHLTGPYRPEISAILSLGSSWFSIVDSTQSNMSSVLSNFPTHVIYNNFGGKYLLIPAVPIAAGAVVLTPIVTGVLLVGLPFFLPLLAAIATIASVIGALSVILYFSTEQGRERLGQSFVYPLTNTVVHTPAGQRLIYDVGPRPTPKSLAQTVLPTDIWSKLVVSLVIDFVGSSSYLIPIAGEALDLSWAPIQTVLIAAMYDDVSPNLKYLSFVEEILPLTDVIPSATLGWTREFGPGLWMEGMGKVKDVRMVVEREREALRSM